jgi:hypothetical protein
LHQKAVQSTKLRSPPQPPKSKKRRSSPTTDNFPACAGPNIHGGAEAWRAGRLDVPDLFASFWIKPKRRRSVPKQNRPVNEAPVTIPNQKSKEPTLSPISRYHPNVRQAEHPRRRRGLAGRPIGCS